MGGAYASITLSFPSSNGSGTLGNGIVWHCNTNTSVDFPVTITLQSPLTGGGAPNIAVLQPTWSGSARGPLLQSFSVPNDGAPHTYTPSWSMDRKLFDYASLFAINCYWSLSSSELSSSFYIINQSLISKIADKQENGAIVLAGCTSTVPLFSKAYVCIGTSVNYTLNVTKLDLNDNPTGATATKAMNSTEISQLNSGTFSLATFCSSGVGGTVINFTNNTKYQVQVIANNGSGLWMNTVQNFMYKTGNWDLIIKDYNTLKSLCCTPWSPDDNGQEKDQTTENIFKSPSVWNNVFNTSGYGNTVTFKEDIVGPSLHRDPDYSTGNINPNYMFTQVDNIGCVTSPINTMNLRMFWTRARLGELWTNHWLFDMTNNSVFYTPVGTSTAVSAPAGSEITISGATSSTPYNTASSPITLPAISSNPSLNSYIITPKTWYAPNPIWYTANNGSMSGNNEPVLCLLSRLQETTSTADPVVWEPASINQDIEPYARQNNNIATRNTHLVDGPQNYTWGGSTSTNETEFATVVANNPTSHPTRICIRNISEVKSSTDNLLNYGALRIGFTNLIWSNWVAYGMSGTGFSVISPGLLMATNPDSICFDSLNIGNNMQEQIGVEMVWNGTAPSAPIAFEYAIQQSNAANHPLYRGSDVVLQFPIEPFETTALKNGNIGENQKQEKNGNYGISTGTPNIIDNSNILLFPNPASNNAILSISGLSGNERIIIQMRDITGKLIYDSVDYSFKNGLIAASFNTESLSKGIYMVNININGQLKSLKLIIE